MFGIGSRSRFQTSCGLFQSKNKEAVKNQDVDVMNLNKAAQWVCADTLRIFYSLRAMF